MELSIFLAKLFGIYFLAIAVLAAVRGDVFAQVVEEFFANRALIFLSGLLALAIGIAMIIGHSVWELSWRGAITFFGYMSIAKGVARIAFPDLLPTKLLRVITKSPGKWAWIAFMGLIGAWLAWAGFSR